MSWIKERLKSFSSRLALIESGKAISYSDFVSCIEKAEANLSGSKVIPIESDSTVDGLALLIAIAESDHIALPLPQELPEAERSRMRELSASSPLYEQLKGSGLILFSSGTCGKPKGMLHDLPALLNRFEQVAPRNDRTLQLLLIDHIGGIDAAFRCLCSGSTLVIPEARTPEAAGGAIETHKTNILPASPTFLNLMLMKGIHKQYDCSSIEIIAYGAEAMSQQLLDRLADAFPNADLQQKFGTSETGAIRIQSSSKNSLFFRIKDQATEWKVINEELWLKTPSRILGYLNAENNKLEEDGWYCTGDQVTEEDGFLKIIGRREDFINVGGAKTNPSEIERIILEMPEVIECTVYAKENPITGQTVAAEIVSDTHMDKTLLKRRIKQYCRSKLSAYKIPTYITFCDQSSLNHRLKKSRKERN